MPYCHEGVYSHKELCSRTGQFQLEDAEIIIKIINTQYKKIFSMLHLHFPSMLYYCTVHGYLGTKERECLYCLFRMEDHISIIRCRLQEQPIKPLCL